MANRRSPDPPRPAATAARSTAAQRGARAPKAAPASTLVALTAEARHAMIAESAYLRAEQRGFEPGHETEDWLAAEVEVDVLLRVAHGGSSQ
jgi:hypothetical protein